MQTTRVSLSDFPLKDRVKIIAGNLLASIFPSTASGVREDPFAEGRGMVGKLIRRSEGYRAVKSNDSTALRKRFSAFWEGEDGEAFYDEFAHRFEECFLGDHYAIVEHLRGLGDTCAIYEVGCGDGRVLEHLSKEFPSARRLVGIDLNSERISKNAEAYDGSRIEFVCGDAMAWLMENAEPGAVVFTYGGVLEYFTQVELSELFSMMADRGVGIALTEPLGADFDIESGSESVPYGLELSYSHNYPALLKEQGFTIRFEVEHTMENRWIQIVAEAE